MTKIFMLTKQGESFSERFFPHSGAFTFPALEGALVYLQWVARLT
jgi:hypothetical protein